MLRLACGIAIVAFIYAHSPERPRGSLSDDAAGWIARTRTEMAEAALRSDAARDLLRGGLVSADIAAAKPAR